MPHMPIANQLFGTWSNGDADVLHTYSDPWGDITLTFHHPVTLRPEARDALVKLLAQALVEDFRRNPPRP